MTSLMINIAKELKERSDCDRKYGYYTSHLKSMKVFSNYITEQLSLKLSEEDCKTLLKIIQDVFIKWSNDIQIYNQSTHNLSFFQSSIVKIQEKL